MAGMTALAFVAFFVAVVLICVAMPGGPRLTNDEVVEMVARGSKLGHLPPEEAQRKARRWMQLGQYAALAGTGAICTLALWAAWTWG